MSSLTKLSPSKSPKKPFQPRQQQDFLQPLAPRYSHQARPSPGTLKKQHPYTFNPSNQQEQPSIDELEYYKARCRDLESQPKSLDQSLDMERASRMLAQKRNEADLWKQKYENQLSQLMQVKANYELEVQNLSQEVQRLLSKLDEFEYEKQRSVDEARLQFEQNQLYNLDSMKKSHFQQSELMEIQVRKLREAVDERELEINELREKLDRNKQEDDGEINRLLRDNEQLRSRINMIELDRQKELESLRGKLEGYSQSTIENLRKTHSNQIQVLESEIEKLRGLLEIKNAEIETLVQQNIKIKQTYELQLQEAKLEIDGLKGKLLDNEHLHRNLFQELQSQIIDENNNELQNIKRNYESSIDTLQDEIDQLNRLLEQKSKELQHCISERQQQREYLDSQLNHLEVELDESKERCRLIEKDRNLQIEQVELELQRSQQLSNEQREQYKQQVQFLECELARLKEVANCKNKDLDIQGQQFSMIKKQIEEEVRNAKYENEQLKQRIYDSERGKSLEIEELKQRNGQMDQFFREKCRQLEIKNESVSSELKRSRELLDIKQNELDSQCQQSKSFEKEMKRMNIENEQLKSQVIQIERQKLNEFDELRMKLEGSSAYQIENLKTAFNTQLNILSSENQDLKNVIDNKSRDIQELLEKYFLFNYIMARYQSLDRALNSGNYGPEAYANKNIYDVYLRTKNRLSSLNKK